MSDFDRGGKGDDGATHRPASAPPAGPHRTPSREQLERMELAAMRGQIVGLRELLAETQVRLNRAEGERVDAALLGRLMAQVAMLEGRVAESDARVRAVEARERDVIEVTRREAEQSAQGSLETHARALDALRAEHARVVDGLREAHGRAMDSLRADRERAMEQVRTASLDALEGTRRSLEGTQNELAATRRALETERHELESVRHELDTVRRGRDAERDRADGFVQRVRAADDAVEAARLAAEQNALQSAKMATRVAAAEAQARAAREQLEAVERAAVDGATRLNEIERRELEATRLRARWMASTRRVIEDSGKARRVLSEVAQLFAAGTRDSARPGGVGAADPRARPSVRPPLVTVDAHGEASPDGDEPALTLEDDDETDARHRR